MKVEPGYKHDNVNVLKDEIECRISIPASIQKGYDDQSIVLCVPWMNMIMTMKMLQ